MSARPTGRFRESTSGRSWAENAWCRYMHYYTTVCILGVSFRRLPFTPLSQQPPRIASKGLPTRTVFCLILPMVHVPALWGIDRIKRVTGNIC